MRAAAALVLLLVPRLLFRLLGWPARTCSKCRGSGRTLLCSFPRGGCRVVEQDCSVCDGTGRVRP